MQLGKRDALPWPSCLLIVPHLRCYCKEEAPRDNNTLARRSLLSEDHHKKRREKERDAEPLTDDPERFHVGATPPKTEAYVPVIYAVTSCVPSFVISTCTLSANGIGPTKLSSSTLPV